MKWRNGFKLHQGRFGLNIRKDFFTGRVPREVEVSPSLELFRKHEEVGTGLSGEHSGSGLSVGLTSP